MTTDDIVHLVEKYDIESQVQGEKFVPKQLDLTRLNVNDLSRKDLLTSKRVRVRRVDISGVLQVGIGNASRDSTDDENRFLRQQLNDLQSKVGTIANDTDALKSQTATMSQVQGALTNDMSTLKTQAAHIHVYSCTKHSSDMVFLNGNDAMTPILAAAMSHGNSCPPRKYLTHWQLVGSDNLYFWHYELTCC